MPAPPQPLKVFKRAIAAYESGNLAKTAEFCWATIERVPDHFDALYLLAVVTSRRGAPAKALGIFDKAVALRPGNAEILVNRASALTELERHEEALKDYDKALELAPSHALARNGRGNVLMRLKRFEGALVDYGNALVLAPQNGEIVNNLGRALMKLERHEEAEASPLYSPAVLRVRARRGIFVDRTPDLTNVGSWRSLCGNALIC